MGLVNWYRTMIPGRQLEKVFENEKYRVSVDYYGYNPAGYRLTMIGNGIIVIIMLYLTFFQHIGMENLITIMLLTLATTIEPLAAREFYKRRPRFLKVQVRSFKPLAYEKELPPITVGSKTLNSQLSKLKERKSKNYYRYSFSPAKVDPEAESFAVRLGSTSLAVPSPIDMVNNHYYKVPVGVIITLLNPDGLAPDHRQPPISRLRLALSLLAVLMVFPVLLFIMYVSLF